MSLREETTGVDGAMTAPPTEPARRADEAPGGREHRWAVVLNPHAGRGLAGRAWPRVEAHLRQLGVPFDVLRTESAQAASAALAQLPPATPLLAVGGDGTVRGLLDAATGARRPLAIVPLGTGNDFAGMLGLRSGDIEGALRRLSSVPRPTDTLTVEAAGERVTLLNGLGMGFDAHVAALVHLAPARLSGLGRYAWAALRALRTLRSADVKVLLDGNVAYQGPACLVAVMNGTRYGGGFRIAPEADPCDGRLDVVLGGRLSRPQVLRLMGSLLRGAHLDDPRVRCWTAQTVTLRWDVPTHTHLDGDVAGELTEVTVGVRPGALLLH